MSKHAAIIVSAVLALGASTGIANAGGWRALHIDGTSQAAFEKSVAAIRQTLPMNKRLQFELASADMAACRAEGGRGSQCRSSRADLLREARRSWVQRGHSRRRAGRLEDLCRALPDKTALAVHVGRSHACHHPDLNERLRRSDDSLSRAWLERRALRARGRAANRAARTDSVRRLLCAP